MVLPSLPFFRIIVFFSLIRFHRPTAEGNNGRILLQDIEWNKRRTVIPYARISVKGEAVLPSSSMRLAEYRERETTNLNQLKFNPEPRSRRNLPPCPRLSSFCSVTLFLRSFVFFFCISAFASLEYISRQC